ncbi:hypothetical protein [Kitasatospora sp. GAS1066B]|uniref:hypothetical protein n=1 Tax=Kitasatospora sp. GAS1066B TaxID=3156271 RepID=UPI00351414C0
MPKLTDRRMLTSRRLLAASGICVLALAVSACGSSASSSHTSGNGAAAAPGPVAATAPATTPAAPATPGAGAGASVQLVAVNSAQLGPIVTDAAGRTLYRFDKDTNKPSATNCTDACAVKWPPATVADKVEVNGVSSALVGSVTRPDGSKQLTLNGWPLYRFAGDSAAGQVNGQGVGGTWFASTPEGKKAQSAGPGSAPAAFPNSSQSSGYSGGNSGSGSGGYSGGY